jgi:nifR3 family TIM-barrel protein
MLKLGNIILDAPFFQASLSGYTDYAMRKLAVSFGSPLVFTGVMLAKSAAHRQVLNKTCFRPGDDEHPIGAQILGRSPATMARAAEALVETGYDLIDLNFACPAPKVLRRGRGGALLNEPDLAIDIYRAVRDAVDCPVLVKLRRGFNNSAKSKDNFWEIVTRLAEENIDAVIVHPRTVTEKYLGTADWRILAELKQRLLKTTILGSGDLLSARTAAERLTASGIDGVVIARGAIGNPWIFRDLRAILNGSDKPAPADLAQQRQVMLDHFQIVERIYKHPESVRFFRKFVAGYCKSHPLRKKAQKDLLAAKNRNELFARIEQWYKIA